MGSVFSRPKVTDELDALSEQIVTYRTGISSLNERRVSSLYYATLIMFFVASTLSAYLFTRIPKRNHLVLSCIVVFTTAIFALFIIRRIVNAFYDHRLSQYKNNVDLLVEKKRTILSKVKETETFKVAKAILDKYEEPEDDNPKVPTTSTNSAAGDTPHTPTTAKASTATRGPRLSLIANPSAATPVRPNPNMPLIPKAGPGFVMKANDVPTMSLSTPYSARPAIRPIRPFQKTSTGVLDRMVDYFFADGPNDRMALICSNCHVHNGMALPTEFEYMQYVCYACGFFNPSRKSRLYPNKIPIHNSGRSDDAVAVASVKDPSIEDPEKTLEGDTPIESKDTESSNTNSDKDKISNANANLATEST